MKILVLSDNYVPEIAAPSFRVRDHARAWIDAGHEVTVVTCAPNWPHGRLFPGYRNRAYQEEWIDGVRVIRLWSYMAANRGFLKRTLDYLSFMASAVAFAGKYPEFDVIVATSPQFFTAVAGWVLSRLRRRPWVFELRDLWPESIRAVGTSLGPLLGWLERLELFLYRRADRIIALTESFRKNLVGRGIAAEKIDVVTNGVNLEQFHPGRVKLDVRRRLGIGPDDFLAGYIGTTGMAHGLETLVDAAEQTRDRPELKWLIMGEGARREALEARARDKGLTNLCFLDRVPQQQLPAYLAALDLAVIHLKPDPVFRTVIPSKVFEFMAMGVPVLMAVEGEAAEIVAGAGCGLSIPSGNAEAMARAVKHLAADRPALATMGRRGQEAAASQFNRRVKALAALDSLRAAVAGPSQPARTASPLPHEKLPSQGAR